MPITFFAHQSVVLPAKMRRPQWFDGTALVIGSMAPDFAYPLRGWIQRHGHQFDGMLVWGLPFTIVVTLTIRSIVADAAFAHLPDCGPLRLHSYRALARRRPAWYLTVSSALVGVASHILLDSVTHKQAFAARWLGLDRTLWRAPWDSGVSIARTLQYVGHILGTIGCVLMLAAIGRRRLMEHWYGEVTIAQVRRFRLRRSQRIRFWVIVLAGVPIAPLWRLFVYGSVVTKLFFSVAATTLVACLLPSCRPREIPLTYFDVPTTPERRAVRR